MSTSTEPIVVSCPNCTKQLKAPAAALGKTATCRSCGAKFTVEPPSSEPISELPSPAAVASVDNDFDLPVSAIAAGEHQQFAETISPEEALEQSPPPESALMPCPDCGCEISRRAMTCPQCGCPISLRATAPLVVRADLEPSFLRVLILAAGLCVVIYFAAGYDTTSSGVHNIGLLNQQLIGVIIGIGLCLAGLLPSRLRFLYSEPQLRLGPIMIIGGLLTWIASIAYMLLKRDPMSSNVGAALASTIGFLAAVYGVFEVVAHRRRGP